MSEIDVGPTYGLPKILDKAAFDQWRYVIETKSGQQFAFGSIEVCSTDGWIHLNAIDDQYKTRDSLYPMDCPLNSDIHFVRERGIDIRMDSIAWAGEGYS